MVICWLGKSWLEVEAWTIASLQPQVVLYTALIQAISFLAIKVQEYIRNLYCKEVHGRTD
jgi:hypothetical protein